MRRTFQKIYHLIRWGSNFILVAVPIFHLLTIYWGPQQKYWEPLGRNLNIDYTLGMLILIVNLLFLNSILVSPLKIGYKWLLMIIAIPFVCVSSYRSYWSHERILETLEFNHDYYHLSVNHGLGDSWDVYNL